MYRQNNTVPLTSGRVHKHTVTHARRIVKTMTSAQTPEDTRRALHHALRRLFACTDIGRRQSLAKVEHVAAVLACTGLYYLGVEYQAAREARTALCRVMEDYDRVVRPWLFPWLKARQPAERPTAHRAQRPQVMPLRPGPLALRVAA
jgi:hypothetical protein